MFRNVSSSFLSWRCYHFNFPDFSVLNVNFRSFNIKSLDLIPDLDVLYFLGLWQPGLVTSKEFSAQIKQGRIRAGGRCQISHGLEKDRLNLYLIKLTASLAFSYYRKFRLRSLTDHLYVVC